MATPIYETKSAGTHDELIAEIVGELSRTRATRPGLDIAPYIQAHPECEQRLRQLLPAIEVLADLGPDSDEPDSTMFDEKGYPLRSTDIYMLWSHFLALPPTIDL